MKPTDRDYQKWGRFANRPSALGGRIFDPSGEQRDFLKASHAASIHLAQLVAKTVGGEKFAFQFAVTQVQPD